MTYFRLKADPTKIIQVYSIKRQIVTHYPAGGGFQDTMLAYELETLWEPCQWPPTDYRRALVYLDPSVDGQLYDAIITSERWNGWQCPYFTFEQAQSIVQEMPEMKYDEIKDEFTHLFEDDDLVGRYPAVHIQLEGERIKVYPIGASNWCWQKVED